MILVTNDDGIFAPGLWSLAGALTALGKVVIVAPDRERSAIGTALTLRRPLRIRRAHSQLPDIEAYATDGTPGDCVIIATSNLFENQITLVVSGINECLNLGDDVLISGTVGAALQGYLRDLPAIAISAMTTGEISRGTAARYGALIAEHIIRGKLPRPMFLNINLPDGPPSGIKGVAITHPAHKSHLDYAKESSDGRQKYYWLTRRSLGADPPDGTDIWAINHRLVSITPLHSTFFGFPSTGLGESFCDNLLTQIKSN